MQAIKYTNGVESLPKFPINRAKEPPLQNNYDEQLMKYVKYVTKYTKDLYKHQERADNLKRKKQERKKKWQFRQGHITEEKYEAWKTEAKAKEEAKQNKQASDDGDEGLKPVSLPCFADEQIFVDVDGGTGDPKDMY